MSNFETAEETAKRWGTSHSWVCKLCRRGEIYRAFKHGKDWWIPIGANKPMARKHGRPKKAK